MPKTNTARPIVRFHKAHCSILCPMGHIIGYRALDTSWGGSQFAADVASIQHGSPSGYDERALNCDGAGHAEGAAILVEELAS